MEENIKVTGRLLTVMEKLPLSSVNVPKSVPFTVTDTAEAFSLELLFLTLPLMVTFCADADSQLRLTSRQVTK